MPEISRFFGIVVKLNTNDHSPPHFHAEYGDYEIVVDIESGIVEGKFPRRATQHVLEWFEAHRSELSANWDLARQGKPLRRIAPLE